MALGMNIGTLRVHLKMVSGDLYRGLDTAEKRMKSFANGMRAMGTTMSMALTVPLTMAGKSVTKEFLNFEQALSNTMAVAKDKTMETRKAFKDMAVDLSKQLPLDPTTLVQGLEDISRAGLNTAQALEALPTIAKFDIAGKFGSIDFATKQLVGSMNALGMASEDPIENMKGLVKVADTLAFASLNSIGVIEDFSLALNNYAGQSARMAGTRIESVVAALMAFRQQGIKGQRAGYRMAQVFRDLARTVRINESAWNALGVDIFEGGEMRDLVDIIIDVENAFDGMSYQQEQAEFAMLGFQERSKLATQTLIDFGDVMEMNRDMMIKYTGTGEYLNQITKIMSSSFKSQLKILWNLLFTLRSDVGKIITKDMLKAAEAVTKVAVGWEVLSDSAKEAIVHMGMLLAAMGPVLLLASAILKIFLLWPLQILKSALAGTLMFGKWVIAASPFIAAAIAIVWALYEINEAWKNMGPTGNSILTDLKRGVDALIGSLKELKEWFEEIDELYNIKKKAGDLLSKIDPGKGRAHTSFGTVPQYERSQFKLRVEWGGDPSAVDAITGRRPPSKAAVQKYIDGVGFNLNEYMKLPSIDDILKPKDTKGGVFEDLKKRMSGFLDWAKKEVPGVAAIGDIWETLSDPYQYNEMLKQMDKAAAERERIARVAGSPEAAVDSFTKVFEGLNKKSAEYFQVERHNITLQMEVWEMYKNDISKKYDLTVEQIDNLIAKYREFQEALLEIEEAKAGQNIFAGFAAGVHEAVLNMETLGELGANIAQTFIEDIATAVDDIARGTREWNDALRDVASTIASMMIKTGIQNALSLAMGGMSGNGGLMGAIGGLFGGGGGAMQGPATMGMGGAGVFDMSGAGLLPSVPGSGVSPDISSFVFANAPKYHSGGIIGSEERPIIATKDEGVFTPGQMKALGGSRMSDKILQNILKVLTKRQKLDAQIVDHRNVVTQEDLEGRVGQEAVAYHLSRSR